MQSAGSELPNAIVTSPNDAGRKDDPSQRHLPLLDGLRGLAILMVLVLHVGHTSSSPMRIDWLVRKIATTGWMGVDLFFVLSGFLITGILLDAKADPHYFRNFYMRRVLRIFPLNYAFLVALLIIVPWMLPAVAASFGKPPAFTLPYWLFLGNFANVINPNQCASLEALWSLAIEEQFYLVWPLIVLLLRPRTFGRLCLALAILSPLLRGILVLRGVPYDTLTNLTFTHLDPIVLGSWLAVARRTGGLRRFVPAAWVLAMILPIVLLAMSISAVMLSNNRVFAVFGFSLVSLMFGAVMTLTLERVRLMQVFNLAWLRWFGRRSYCIYLCNLPVIDALDKFGFDPDAKVLPGHLALPRVALFFVLTLIGCGLVATASWHLLEKRFLRLKSLFPRRSPATATLPAEATALAAPDPVGSTATI